jgi:transcriptional regulator with XRE-family HTH domain
MTSPKLPNTAEYEALGRALRALRRKAGLTQAQAAERIGRKAGLTQAQAAERVHIRPQFVSEVENGRRGMRWHTLTATVRAYGATLAQLAAEIEGERE